MKPISVLQVAQADGEVIITNDGATILNKMRVEQPAAKMLVDLAKSQVRLGSSLVLLSIKSIRTAIAKCWSTSQSRRLGVNAALSVM